MKKQKLFKLICLVTAMSLTLSLFPVELHAESSVKEASVLEDRVFDENAHGEVVEEGECGENAKYKLYKLKLRT